MSTVHYFYDPMCGWCYGASALIQALDQSEQFELVYHPGGMIERNQIENGFKQHILMADQRIGQMTGAEFGAGYIERVKSNEPLVMDSYLVIRAIMVAEEMGLNPLTMIKAVQKAHYQEGRHIEEMDTLEAIAVEHGLDAEVWREKMNSGAAKANQLINESRSLMSKAGVGGFPTMFVEKDGNWKQLPHSQYYGRVEDWKAFLNTL